MSKKKKMGVWHFDPKKKTRDAIYLGRIKLTKKDLAMYEGALGRKPSYKRIIKGGFSFNWMQYRRYRIIFISYGLLRTI